MERGEEASLVARVADGDRAAFAVLVREHQGSLSAYARRMLSDSDGADDIVQETLLRLWTRADRYNSAAARLSTWLHNIAHNLCIDSFRKNGRITFTDQSDDRPSDLNSPAEDHEAQDGSRRVQQALGMLPERQRSALLLCHYQGLSNRDAAQILEVSVDALESLLARARRGLKKELDIDDKS